MFIPIFSLFSAFPNTVKKKSDIHDVVTRYYQIKLVRNIQEEKNQLLKIKFRRGFNLIVSHDPPILF